MSAHWVQPRISFLDREQIAFVHERSLAILSSTGVRVDSLLARQALLQAGAEIGADLDETRVRLPAELVEWALRVAPPSVDIYDRHGQMAFRLGDGVPTRFGVGVPTRFGVGVPTRFGVGVTTLYYQDPQTDRVEPFMRRHMETTVRLGQALTSFDAISTVGVIRDVAPEIADLVATLEMSANTTKPLILLVSKDERFADVLDLLTHLHGDLADKPFVILYVNPITPLAINAGTAHKMQIAIERGLPFIFSNYGMAGATTPIAPAGALVLLNAELLAGLVLSQALREGAPVILGSLPAFFDMKRLGSFYDVTSYTLNLACAEMMAFYRLPHCGTSGSGIGWGPDAIAVAHQWINHLTACSSKVGMAPFVGGTLGDKAFSPALLVYADEVIAQARRFARGFALDDEALALDEIAQVGPGGDFLTAGSTLARFRDAYYNSEMFPNLSLEAWQVEGCPRAVERLRKRTVELLAALGPLSDHADLMRRGEGWIAERFS